MAKALKKENWKVMGYPRQGRGKLMLGPKVMEIGAVTYVPRVPRSVALKRAKYDYSAWVVTNVK